MAYSMDQDPTARLSAALLNYATPSEASQPPISLSPAQQVLLEFKLRGAFGSLIETLEYGASPDVGYRRD